MKLDYIPDGSPDAPLIRLHDFTPAEVRALYAAILELAAGDVEQVAVHELSFVEPQAGCRLTLVRAGRDQGVVIRNRTGDFACGLTADTWDNVAGLVEPFATDANGFQWLTDVPGEAATLLLSPSGRW